jgi:hypothetical protein
VKPVRFHPEAEAELAAEAKYYEEHAAGLGELFVHEFHAAVVLASTFPQIGTPHMHGTRRVFPKGFPKGNKWFKSFASLTRDGLKPAP